MGDDVKQKEMYKTRKMKVISFYEELRACACKLFKEKGCSGADSVLPGTGRSAADLAGDTIVNLIEGGYWHPEDEEVPIAFAYRMMERDFLDIIRRAEYKLTEITDSIDGKYDQSEVDNLPSPDTGFEAAEAELLVGSLKRLLGRDEQAKAYLDVWLIQGLESRPDVARALGVSEQEVTNIRRRLRDKTRLWERIFPDARPGEGEKV